MADRDTTEQGATPWYKVPATRRASILIAAALVVFFLLVLPVFSTLQPGYYERYQALRPQMASWRTSTHAVWSCSSCHVGSGLGELAAFAARSIPDFYGQLILGPSKTNLFGAPGNEACRSCHTVYRSVSPGGDLIIPHRAHVVVLKLRCVLCHQKLVHYPNVAGYNRPRMIFCLAECHDGKKATDKCQKCHTRKQVPASHKARGWLATHGKRTGETDCGSCHGWTPRLCETCHEQRPKTHTGNWKKLHRQRAKERRKGCLVCHGGRKFCLKCHDETLFRKL